MIIILESVTLVLSFCAVVFGYEMPPSFFTLYGENNGEYSVISGDCNYLDWHETTISCNFARIEIRQPPKRVNETTQVELDGWEYAEHPNTALANRLSQELNHLIPTEEKGLKDATDADRLKKDLALQQEWLDDLQKHRPFLTNKDKADMNKLGLSDEKQNKALLNDPEGPKTREYNRELIDYGADLAKQEKLEVEKELRTCEGRVTQFHANLKRFGNARWLSGEIGDDDVELGSEVGDETKICGVIEIYEITNEGLSSWSLKRTYVSVDSSPACRAITHGAMSLSPKIYNASGVNDEFEPQCDFITWLGM